MNVIKEENEKIGLHLDLTELDEELKNDIQLSYFIIIIFIKRKSII